MHGGPNSHWSRDYDPFVAFFVSKNYLVLKPNIRGSTGYGYNHMASIYNDWGGRDLEDLIAAYDYLLKNFNVDIKNISILGHSYGAYLAFFAGVKFPHLWKSIVVWSGFYHLPSLYFSSSMRKMILDQMGSPFENKNYGMREAL